MRQFVQLWVCRHLSLGSFYPLPSHLRDTLPFLTPRSVFLPSSPLPPRPLPPWWLLKIRWEGVIQRFRIKCAICFKKQNEKKPSNKKRGIRVIAPFIFCEEDGRVQKDHPAWLKFPKSPAVGYCCTLGNRLALDWLKVVGGLNGAYCTGARVHGDPSAAFIHFKQKKDRTCLHEARWQHQYMWQSIMVTWANLQEARVVRGHLSEDRQLRHGGGIHRGHQDCVQRVGRGGEQREEEVQVLGGGDLEQEPRGADCTGDLSCQRESSWSDPFIAWSGLRGCISQCSRRFRWLSSAGRTPRAWQPSAACGPPDAASSPESVPGWVAPDLSMASLALEEGPFSPDQSRRLMAL